MEPEVLAKVVERVNGLFEGDDSLPNLFDRVKECATMLGTLKDTDLPAVVEKVEEMRARQDACEKAIRGSTKGFYTPGIEAEGKNFSLLRAMVGVRTGEWKGRELEKEILDEARTKAALIIGDDAVGGYFVPDQVIPDVIAAIYAKSVLINLQGEGPGNRISVIDGLQGGNVKIPKFEGGTVAYWIGEEDDYTESAVAVGDVSMTPKKLGVLVRLTDSMRKLGAFGFEGLVRNDMIRAAAKKLDWTVLFGNGSDDMPRGIVNHQGIKIYRQETGEVITQAAAADVADWDGGEANFDMLSLMKLALEEDDIDFDGSPIISSPRFFDYLKRLKQSFFSGQSTDQAYLLGLPMFTDAQLKELIGDFDWSTQIRSDDLPGETINGTTDNTDAKHTGVLMGNLPEVLLGRWFGLEIEDDAGKGKGFVSDHIYMKLRLRADVALRQARGILYCPDAKVRA